MEDLESILKIASFLKASTVSDKETHFHERFKVFRTKYPQLYKKACTEPDFDIDNLGFMLSMLDKVKKNEKDQLGAETLVGQMLFDKYVDPNKKKD